MSKFILYLKTKSFRNNLLAAVITVAILLFIAFFSLRYYTKHGQGLHVPSLKGLSFTQAVGKLEELGLRYEVDSVYVGNSQPGVVLDQDPNPNTFVKDNRTIYLTVSMNTAPNVKFPDVETKSLREAQAIIESFGLKLGDTTYRADIAKDIVLQASFGGSPIAVGQVIPKGSRIDFLLGDGSGNEEVEIPSLVGLAKDEALFSLKGVKLILGMVTYEGEITDTATAVVVRQDPSITDSLTKVKQGTPINITLSNKK